MAALDGISTLAKVLGSLSTDATAGPAATAKTRSVAAGSTSSSAGLGSSDQTNVSSAAGLLAQSVGTSDVRTEKVAQLQQAIASGSYQVPAAEVAGKLIEHLLS